MRKTSLGRVLFALDSMTWKGLLAVPVLFLFGHWFATAAQRSLCAFDPCQPMSWGEKWAIPLLGSVLVVIFTVLSDLARTKDNRRQTGE